MAIFLWPWSTIVLSEPTDSVSNDEPIGKNIGLLNHTALATSPPTTGIFLSSR